MGCTRMVPGFSGEREYRPVQYMEKPLSVNSEKRKIFPEKKRYSANLTKKDLTYVYHGIKW
jgi:hypothetical protein